MENQPKKKYTKMEKLPMKKLAHSKAKHLVTHPEKKFNCNHCNYSSNYKHNLSRHTEFKHPVKHTKKTLLKTKSYIDIKSIKCWCKPMFYTFQDTIKKRKPNKNSSTTNGDMNSIKCVCKHMFYTNQNSLKAAKPSKKSTSKHEDKQ